MSAFSEDACSMAPFASATDSSGVVAHRMLARAILTVLTCRLRWLEVRDRSADRSPLGGTGLARRLPGVVGGAEEVERDVRLVADHPAIVRLGRDVEQLAGPELDHPAVSERRRRGARQHEAHVLHGASGLPERRADVLRPAPAGLVRRSTDREPPEVNELEAPLQQLADLVRLLEPLQDDVGLHGSEGRRTTVKPPNASAESRAARGRGALQANVRHGRHAHNPSPRPGGVSPQRRTGSGASWYFRYLPSSLPTATSAGKMNRCTAAGIATIAYSLRYRRVRNAASNGSGRPPPCRFADAKISVRKYSTLSAGSTRPMQRRSPSPAFQNRCASPGLKTTVSPGPANRSGSPSRW